MGFTILITGGLGYAGGRLAKTLSARYPVTVSSRKTAAPELLALHGGVRLVLHNDLLSSHTFPGGIHTVIHMAALNEHDCVAFPSEAIRVNIDETRMILENAIAAGVQRFIYFSTAHVYGSPLQGDITEETLPAPMHPYAITHRAAEDYVLGTQKKIQVIVMRLSNSFGAPVHTGVNRWTLLVNDLCRQAVETGTLRLSSNGCQYRDFICLTDVERVVAHMLQTTPGHNLYNLGSGRAMRVKDMAAMIAAQYKALTGKTAELVLPANAIETEEPALHYRIERLLNDGYTVEHNVEEELARFLVFCRDNFEKQH